MKKLMIPAVAIAMMTCGCLSVDVTRDGDVDAQQYLDDCSFNPYKINYKIGKQRVKGTGHSECWCWIFSFNDGRHMTPPGFTFSSAVRSAKESATFEAVENAKADTLLGAMYRTTQTSKWLGFYKSVDSEVIGFPAYVNEIQQIEDRPVLLHQGDQVIRVKPWEKLK